MTAPTQAEIDRFDFGADGLTIKYNGDFVTYDDYAALQAERDAAVARAEAAEERDIWIDPSRYTDNCDIAQVLCEVTEPNISQFPRSCELPISSGDHAISDKFVSIGWRDDDGEWFVAGWDMTQDCWTDARCFVVRGFRPMADASPSAALSTNSTVERVQHIKRGTTYQIIARGKLQTDTPLEDYAELVAYRCEETGDVWFRPQSEFTPDRFAALPAAAKEV